MMIELKYITTILLAAKAIIKTLFYTKKHQMLTR